MNVLQCLHPSEGFADVPHLEQDRAHDNTLAPPSGREEKISGDMARYFAGTNSTTPASMYWPPVV
jgi:hypothetical protein